MTSRPPCEIGLPTPPDGPRGPPPTSPRARPRCDDPRSALKPSRRRRRQAARRLGRGHLRRVPDRADHRQHDRRGDGEPQQQQRPGRLGRRRLLVVQTQQQPERRKYDLARARRNDEGSSRARPAPRKRRGPRARRRRAASRTRQAPQAGVAVRAQRARVQAEQRRRRRSSVRCRASPSLVARKPNERPRVGRPAARARQREGFGRRARCGHATSAGARNSVWPWNGKVSSSGSRIISTWPSAPFEPIAAKLRATSSPGEKKVADQDDFGSRRDRSDRRQLQKAQRDPTSSDAARISREAIDDAARGDRAAGPP